MNSEHAIKGVFFDVDDTLYDHMGPLRHTLREVLKLPEDYPYEEIYHRFRYYSDILSAQQEGSFSEDNIEALEDIRVSRFILTLKEFGIEIDDEQARRLQDDYIGRQYDIEMFEGAEELIDQLMAAGYVVGIITNGLEEHQFKKISAMSLDKRIPLERIFVSGAVGWDKPDVRLFAHVNEKTGVSASNSIYVGDSWRNDVMGTKGTGWTMIWFNHRQVEPESDYKPQYAAKSYEEIRRILLGG
ncbi:HAD family hydrolase [Paenibacillus marinisediminis]